MYMVITINFYLRFLTDIDILCPQETAKVIFKMLSVYLLCRLYVSMVAATNIEIGN